MSGRKHLRYCSHVADLVKVCDCSEELKLRSGLAERLGSFHSTVLNADFAQGYVRARKEDLAVVSGECVVIEEE